MSLKTYCTINLMVDAPEGEIKKQKKGFGRTLIKSRAPKRLWNDCLELESYIQSNTVYGIYKLDGEVPKTILSGETSDSHFYEFEWFDQVMF